jgi:hypothetical protein
MDARIVALVMFLAGCAASPVSSVNSVAPEGGGAADCKESTGAPVLANAAEAIHVARAYMTRAGNSFDAPLYATLAGEVWRVTEANPKEVFVGGGLYITLCRSNGAVISLGAVQ